ncbi:NnrU family protein [Rhodobium gokarnense]|uniref:Membrane protein n=1 Tax=Rhodobium gokarnense TaxID=364296 RepID=A0ABT3HGR4_9HYPH|nr:NnrU family protein [Rhodobium gokarnense]MCW2309514.1 putative membrane protein [Rhodobium gokarnense]
MITFLAALFCFFLFHAVPAQPAVRRRLVAMLGRRPYLAAYSVLSTLLLAWLIVAAWKAPYVPLWAPEPWQAGLAVVLVPIGLFLTVAGAVSANPFSVTLTAAPFDPERPGIIALTRHPVLWGLFFWGFAHTIANGDAVGLILFGTLTVFAGTGTLIADRRARRRLGLEEWERLARGTSNLPLAALVSGKARWTADRAQALGLAASLAASLYLLLAGGHLALFGVDPLIWWR